MKNRMMRIHRKFSLFGVNFWFCLQHALGLSLHIEITTAKEARLQRLHRDLSDAGDRRDSDECDRIEAEIEALEKTR